MLFTGTGASLMLLLHPTLVLGPQLGAILLPDSSLWGRAAAGAAVGAVASFAALTATALLSPGMHVSADAAHIRIRGRVGGAADIDQASLLTDRASGRREDLLVRLHADGRPIRIWLRSGTRVLLSDAEREALARTLEQSSIAPPKSPYDPSGRFARYDFPGSLTREEAVRLVRDVPAPGDPLPVTD